MDRSGFVLACFIHYLTGDPDCYDRMKEIRPVVRESFSKAFRYFMAERTRHGWDVINQPVNDSYFAKDPPVPRAIAKSVKEGEKQKPPPKVMDRFPKSELSTEHSTKPFN